MKLESENFMPEEYKEKEFRPDVLERISAIVENVGKENLEQPEVKKEIEKILENLLKEAQSEEKTNFENYKSEITETIKEARVDLEKKQEELGLSILNQKNKPEDVAQGQIDSLEKLKPEPIIRDYFSPEEMKTKTLLGKAGGIFKNASTLRRWAGILTLATIFNVGGFIGLTKLTESEWLKSEERQEYPELKKLSETCQKIRFIKERFPECWHENEVNFILPTNVPEIPEFVQFINNEIGYLNQKDNILITSRQNFEEKINTLLTVGQYLDRQIKSFEGIEEYSLPEYLCLSQVEYKISGKGENIESYYQTNFTLINLEQSGIVDRFTIKIDPNKIQDPQYQQIIHTEILEKIKQIIEAKQIKEKLPTVPAIKEVEPQILIDQNKFDQISKKQQDLYQRAPEYFQKMQIEFYIDTKDGPKLISLKPDKETLKKPLKVIGKLGQIKFTIPGSKGYQLFLNNKLVEPFIWPNDPERNQIYNLGTASSGGFGTLSGPSQDKEIILLIKDNNDNEIACLTFEQIQEWLMETIYYQNVQKNLDSIRIYCTDPDTLKTYQYFGKEKMMEAMQSLISGAIDVERYFNYDLNIDKIRICSFTEYTTGFFEPRWGQENALNCLAPKIEQVNTLAKNKELWQKNFEITGRHEMLHKLDYILFMLSGKKIKEWELPLFSEVDPSFSSHFEKLLDEYSELNEEQRKHHLFYFIKEGNFYNELNNPGIGHPEEFACEFFVSTLNSAMAEKEKLKTQFQQWPKEVKKQYIETLTIIKNLLHEKGVDTNNLSETIKYLTSLNK